MKTRGALIYLFLFAFIFSQAQRINRLDKNGQRTGKWVSYQDSAKTIKAFEGRFRNGYGVGKSRWYNNEGQVERKEISRFGKLRTTTYHPNGKIRSKGQARLENLSDRIHYYYYGRWKYYNEEGQLVKYTYFEKGQMKQSVYVDKNNKHNDSLISVLNYTESEFQKKNAVLLKELNSNYYNNARCEKIKQNIYAADSTTFITICKILNNYGYPSKSIADESNSIPFFIISHAPYTLREKYEALFVAAAGKGDLDWSSLAHYIDKLKLAQGKKQVFGTQYYYDKKWKVIYYPIEDSLNMNARRKQIGLPDFGE
ncbi:MAG: hypothetical protein IT236_10405 [Bacteroidia bacterium]|nr:hypothetical protein [Bacteroidia bacterium]